MSISLTACLLVAVLVRGVIPVGFMPAPLGAEAMSALTFCVNGLSSQNIAFFHLAQSSPIEGDSHPVHDCAFSAGHGKEYIPSDGIVILLGAWLLSIALLRPRKHGLLGLRQFVLPLGARAPPVC
ncbi:MAG: hypothetical protein ACTJHW_16380 [Paenalcaligenes sp.]